MEEVRGSSPLSPTIRLTTGGDYGGLEGSRDLSWWMSSRQLPDLLMAALAPLVLAAYLFGAGRVAQATSMSPVRVPIGRVQPWPQEPAQLTEWVRQHGEELEPHLRDKEALSRYGRVALPAKQQLLFAHAMASALEPTLEELVVDGSPNDPDHPIERTRMCCRISVPLIEDGQPWIVRDHEVVLGYRRPLPDIEERSEKRERHGDVVTTRARSRTVEGRSVRLSPAEILQPGDQPIRAETVALFVDQNGVVYF